MKKFLFAIILPCLALSLLIFGCGDTQNVDEGNGHKPSSSLSGSGSPDTTPARTDEIFDSPTDLVSFSSLDEFASCLDSAEKGEDIANLASMKSYYLPT